MISSYINFRYTNFAKHVLCAVLITVLTACTGDLDPHPPVEDSRLQACIDEANTVGIENIRSLYCEGSATENGDLKLAGLEQLSALKELIVKYADLQSLPVSVAARLDTLKVSNSELKSFSVSSYKSLRSITLIDNQYQKIDLSDMRGLEFITVNQEFADTVNVILPEQPSLSKLGLLNVAIGNIDLSSSATLRSLVLKDIQGIQTFENPISEYWLHVLIDTDNLPCSAYEYFHLLHGNALVVDIPSNEALNCGAYAQFNNESLARCVDDTHLSFNDITELNCYFSGELTELHLLPNLQSLSVIGRITDIDLTANKDLKQLTLNTPQLTEVDLSANELSQLSLNLAAGTDVTLPESDALTHLELQSSDIDYSRFVNLEYLSVDDPTTRSINVNPLVNLKALHIKNAENLETLIFDNTTELTTLEVHKAKIKTIDASHLPKLTSANFNSPHLTDINLANTQVAEFKVANVANLQHIDLANTPIVTLHLGFSEALQTLNVDGMTELYELAIGNNQLAELDLTAVPALRKLSLGNSSNLERLIFPSNARLQELSVASAPMVEFNGEDLVELRQLSLGSKININRSQATSDEAILNLEALDLAANTKLESIYLGPNRLESLDLSGLELLGSLKVASSSLHTLYLPEPSHLVNLELGENNLSELELTEFNLLSYLNIRVPNITYLDLSKSGSASLLRRISLYDVNGEVTLPTHGLNSLNLYHCGADSVFHNTAVASGVGILQLESCESLPLVTPFIKNVSYLEFRNMTVPDLSTLVNDQAGIVVMENIDNDVIDLSGFSSLIAIDIDDDIVGCDNPGSIIFSEESNLGCAATTGN